MKVKVSLKCKCNGAKSLGVKAAEPLREVRMFAVRSG
jgi:hypothetical protein